MAKDRMTLDEREAILRLVRAEVKSLAESMDDVQLENLKAVGKNVDANTHNIMKLQAQVSALKELLIGKGLVPRERLYELERGALVRIENTAQAQTAGAQA